MNPIVMSYEHIPGDSVSLPRVRFVLRNDYTFHVSPIRIAIFDATPDEPREIHEIKLTPHLPIPAHIFNVPLLEALTHTPAVSGWDNTVGAFFIGHLRASITQEGITFTRGMSDWRAEFTFPARH